MNYRHLGRAGIQVSELSFGSWITFGRQIDVAAAAEMLAAAYDEGVNFFDNAQAYGGGKSEEVMGTALKELGWRRGSYLVSTKFYWGLHDRPNERNTLNRKYLIEGINSSLQRLQLDYVDLIYCHRPDPTTPIEETVRAMHNIIEWGKALYWGTSEWSAAEITQAIEIAERDHLHKPVVEQPQYNLFERHRFAPDYVRVYRNYGYGSTTWSPLASGLLSGKYRNGVPEGSRGAMSGLDWLKNDLADRDKMAKVAALESLAATMDATLAQFSLAWCLQNPFVSSVITGASRIEQLRENMKAMNFVDRFTPELMAKVDGILETDGH
jgi:voltage-dependent potassium channel beta subunit